MDLKQYVTDATRTESRIEKVVVNAALLDNLLAIQILSGTLLDMIKKNVFYNRPIDKTKYDQLVMEMDRAFDFFRPNYYTSRDHDSSDKYKEVLSINPRLFHAIIGIITESAELSQALKLAINGKTDPVNVMEEIGDICWYEAIASDALQVGLDSVLETNIAKLRARFPDKFSNDHANNRNLETERKILEDGVVTPITTG